jgi:hypothetical protein
MKYRADHGSVQKFAQPGREMRRLHAARLRHAFVTSMQVARNRFPRR